MTSGRIAKLASSKEEARAGAKVPRHDCDVLVVGAGVAGLSALHELSKAGCTSLCVEARDRIGGRILTISDPLAPLPVELGPEFIHGRSPELWEIVRDTTLMVYDCTEHA